MSEVRTYDAAVIGAGPGGLFAALMLAEAGLRPVLLEAGGPMIESLCPKVKVVLDGRLGQGSEKFRMQCARCTCLTGLGGAAFHFDTNLGYSSALVRSKIERGPDATLRTFSTLARALGSFDRASEQIAEVFGLLHDLGLPVAAPERPEGESLGGGVFDAADLSVSQSITVDVALEVLDNLVRRFLDAGGEVRFHTRAEALQCDDHGYLVDVETQGEGAAQIRADAVVVAVGKLGMPWVRRAIDDMNLRSTPSAKVDVGVRLESRREQMAPLCEACSNPKLAFINEHGESVRTFCVCAGGRIMQYEFEGAVILDGQHCLTCPTERSNLGIVTTVQVDSGVDGTEYAIEIARKVSAVGGGSPVACTVGELRSGTIHTRDGQAMPLDTSLIDHAHVNLSECLPASLVRDVLQMVDKLNEAFPGLIADSAVVAAPVIERLYPDLALSESMESSAPGLYFVGDASSKIIGVTYAAATGRVAARNIVRAAAQRTRAPETNRAPAQAPVP